MNDINNNSNGEGQEEKQAIKINKKMRMWNRYKNYCFIALGILAVVIIIAVGVELLPDADNNQAANVSTEAQTKDYVAQLGTSDATEGSSEVGSEDTGSTDAPTEVQTEAPTQKPTEAPTQKPTEAPTQKPTEAPTQSSGNVPQKETFTTKDKFTGAVFVGDTVINGISYYKNLPAAQVVSDVNMISKNAAGKVDAVMASNPKKVFIMVGLNDANYGTYTTDNIVSNIEKFVKAVKAKNSATEVYVLSVLPVTKAFESKSTVKQSFLNNLNYALSTKAAGMGAKYIDVATSFKDSNGYMFTQCSGTGCNLKQEYYPYFLNKIATFM